MTVDCEAHCGSEDYMVACLQIMTVDCEAHCGSEDYKPDLKRQYLLPLVRFLQATKIVHGLLSEIGEVRFCVESTVVFHKQYNMEP